MIYHSNLSGRIQSPMKRFRFCGVVLLFQLLLFKFIEEQLAFGCWLHNSPYPNWEIYKKVVNWKSPHNTFRMCVEWFCFSIAGIATADQQTSHIFVVHFAISAILHLLRLLIWLRAAAVAAKAKGAFHNFCTFARDRPYPLARPHPRQCACVHARVWVNECVSVLKHFCRIGRLGQAAVRRQRSTSKLHQPLLFVFERDEPIVYTGIGLSNGRCASETTVIGGARTVIRWNKSIYRKVK